MLITYDTTGRDLSDLGKKCERGEEKENRWTGGKKRNRRHAVAGEGEIETWRESDREAVRS